MDIEVYKFGGSSIQSADRVKKVAEIVKGIESRNTVLIVSAMGKTTNLLEEVVNAHFDQPGRVQAALERVIDYHLRIAEELLPGDDQVVGRLNDLFVELEWGLDDQRPEQYDYVYDQVVAMGELLSSTIVTAFLKAQGVPLIWLDARDLIHTDRNFRNARIDWEKTGESISRLVRPELERQNLVLTQGFIGSTPDNENTTLGREGSDFSAAIFAYCLKVQKVTVWKDVPGVMTADPSRFEAVQKLDVLSFREAIEMTYYGAKVLHPKTIKPLQNRQIPLIVRSFLEPEAPGTSIEDQVDVVYPPIIIVEEDQLLIQLSTPDYTFMEAQHLVDAFNIVAKHGFKMNVIRNTAITLTLVTQDRPRHLPGLLEELEKHYTVRITKDVLLITIRHTHSATEDQLIQGKLILLEERFGNTVQFVTQSLPDYALR